MSTWMIPQKATAQDASVNFQVFYDDLSPYGTWVDNPEYGYVWVPNVAPGFTPYSTNGYWVLTDDGWTWVSNYSWGWAPFHYGRWYTDATYGPIWVPDNEWGPGWVTWRRSGDYYGWAPIGPGVSISMAYSSGYDVPANQWTFVRNRNFGRRDMNNYYVKHSDNDRYIHNSSVINNSRNDRSNHVMYNAGPERAEVEKSAGRKFTPVAIKASNKPGQTLGSTQLQIYRPQVQKNISAGKKPIPSKVATMKEVKPAAQRTATPPQKVGQPVQHQQTPPQKITQPAQHQQTPPQKVTQPAQRQQTPPQKVTQPVQHQQTPPQRTVQPAKQQQSQPQRTVQPAKQQQSQPQRTVQPARQQQSQPQRSVQPARQQQSQPQRSVQPARQQQSQPQRNVQPPKQQQTQQKQAEPPQNKGENPPH